LWLEKITIADICTNQQTTITQRLTTSVSLEVVVFIPLRLSTKYLIIPATEAPTAIVRIAAGKFFLRFFQNGMPLFLEYFLSGFCLKNSAFLAGLKFEQERKTFTLSQS